MFVSLIIVCVFSPRLLVRFGKNLDSKRTIYFEWPNLKLGFKVPTENHGPSSSLKNLFIIIPEDHYALLGPCERSIEDPK